MASMKQLIENYKDGELDYSLVLEYLNGESITPILKYEGSLDMLRVYFTDDPKNKVVFYSEKAVALIVDIATNTVVGLQVDNYEKGFLPDLMAEKKLQNKPTIKKPSSLKPYFRTAFA